MTTITASKIDRATEISFEDAMEEVQQLKDVERKCSGGTEVYSGVHPVHGPIHLVIPMGGSGYRLLPFAIRQF